jgi:hypothetical protein
MRMRDAGRWISIFAVVGVVSATIAACGGAGSNEAGGLDASVMYGGPGSFGQRDSSVTTHDNCIPKSCADQGFNCGMNSDGCGGPLMDCGTCPTGQMCGVGGFSKCGDPTVTPDGGALCKPKTCADFPTGTCGQQSDGCMGLTANCGTCTSPQYCGGGGASLCGGDVTKTPDGSAPCTAQTCASLGFNCGQASDGCGGTIGPCGTCTNPQYCGATASNKCGGNNGMGADGGSLFTCTPKGCAAQGATCGNLGDGCGGTTGVCGTCTNPQFCGGGGPNQCGGNNGLNPDGGIACTPKTCANYPSGTCGPQSDGCGGMTPNCGTCTNPQFCGGGGPGLCGGNNAMTPDGSIISSCVPQTCTSLGFTCGMASDGCGGTIGPCGSCSPPLFCGGGGANLCGVGVPLADGGLVFGHCDAGSPTTVSGVAVAGTDPSRGFGNPDPIYNALVYIAGTTPQPFTTGVACTQCGAEVTGSPIVSTITGPDGKFTLTNAPVGAQNLVIQLGRWRRMVQINVVPCGPNNVGNVRMPRTQNEGGNGVDNIPLMAIATGHADPIECVLRKMGVVDSEFTNDSGTGRVQLWPDNGGTIAGTNSAATLEGSATNLDKYDIVLLPCVGDEEDKTQALQQNVVNYANTGGRVFTTHYSYVWHIDQAQEANPPGGAWTANPWTPEAPWSPDPNQVFNPAPNDTTSITATVDQTFQKGKDFATWLQITGATTTLGQIPLFQTRHDVDSPPAASALRYLYFNTGTNHQSGTQHQTALLHFTFDTPLPPATNQCGRVLFSDFHVNIGVPGQLEPACSTGACYCKDSGGHEVPLTPQERALEFMLFDIASCVTPPTCTPKTCANYPGTCGEQSDGCGGLTANCGSCPTGQTCGGSGVANHCGAPDAGSCTPMTCANYPTGTCGAQTDGCGGLTASCANCPPGTTCGGGGVANQCGAPPSGGCTPLTCANYPANTCGAQSDGCGGLTPDCNPCTPPATCGGGGTPGVCGTPPSGSCTPKTCANYPAGICGQQSDGCGSLTPDCNPCTPPNTCGGGGVPGQCGNTGNCTPLTCAQQGITCGPASNGCGGTIQSCGMCTPPMTCGGGGTAGACGGNRGCMPQTCQSLNINCGPAGDGCGGVIDSCGTCAPPATCGGGGAAGQCGMSIPK